MRVPPGMLSGQVLPWGCPPQALGVHVVPLRSWVALQLVVLLMAPLTVQVWVTVPPSMDSGQVDPTARPLHVTTTHVSPAATYPVSH